MKITIVCHEIPYPPMHGGLVDMWRRIKAIADRGVELQIITWWVGQPPTPATLAEFAKYTDRLEIIEISQTFRSRALRIFDLLQYPLPVSSRRVKGKKYHNLLTRVRDFDPDAIVLDGIHGGEIADRLSRFLDVPLITRSHNIEYLYARRMQRSAITLKSKIWRLLSTFHVERYERYILRRSDAFYDISADDLKFWQSQGYAHGKLLPPIVEIPDRQLDQIEPEYDLVFLGNLRADNNVAGIVWFIDRVWPLIRARHPDATVLIAGSAPTQTIRAICECEPGVFPLFDPPDADRIYRLGRVLINPILTGSGVKIKSVEMLASDRPIVSTPEGVSGLSTRIAQHFQIATDPHEFASKAIDCLEYPEKFPSIDRQLLEASFGPSIIDEFIADLKSYRASR